MSFDYKLPMMVNNQIATFAKEFASTFIIKKYNPNSCALNESEMTPCLEETFGFLGASKQDVTYISKSFP